MSWNNYNISIPSKRVPLGELVVSTTGTTYLNSAADLISPGAIYQDYVCTELTTLIDGPQLLVNPPNGVHSKWGINLINQDPIRITGPGMGETIKWNFTGWDIQSWGDPGVASWIATCFCTNPCTFPSMKSMSGKTMNYTTGQYKTTNIGGTAFDNVNLT